MPVSRNRILLDELEAERAGRYVDLCLILRHRTTRETILWAGGRWDRLDRRFTTQEPESAQILDLHEGQVPFARWFATWLRDYREGLPRDTSLALAGGERRGGKTYCLLECTLAALIDVPGTVGWLVSAAHSERDELDRTILETLIPGWSVYREWPKHVHTFVNGSTATNISADDPETLKRGRVDIAFCNEAQKMPRAVLTNLIGGTADREGIAILAANPPQRSKGEWVYDVREDITLGAYGEDAKFFAFDAKLNPFISQAAKSRVGRILRRIDPAAAVADEDGVWRRPGELAYEAFARIHNVKAAPDLGDITRTFTQKRLGRAYDYIGGYDPNDRPHHAGTMWKVYGTIQDPILWCVDELLVDNADGEEHFLEAAEGLGYGKESIAWIMDNSCFFQNSKHRRNGVVSSDYFKKWGHRCEPNQAAAPGSKTGVPRNPDIELRVALVNKLLHSDPDSGKEPRMYIDPRCKVLAESLKNCKSKKVRHGYGPVGREAHVTDTVGYVAWWTFPRPQRKRTEGPLAIVGERTAPSLFG